MLMKMVKSNFAEEANKALYAVSALIRNNLAGQELFNSEAGHLMLQVTYLRLFLISCYYHCYNYFFLYICYCYHLDIINFLKLLLLLKLTTILGYLEEFEY